MTLKMTMRDAKWSQVSLIFEWRSCNRALAFAGCRCILSRKQSAFIPMAWVDFPILIGFWGWRTLRSSYYAQVISYMVLMTAIFLKCFIVGVYRACFFRGLRQKWDSCVNGFIIIYPRNMHY